MSPTVTLCKIMFYDGQAYFVVDDSAVVGSRRIFARVNQKTIRGGFPEDRWPILDYTDYGRNSSSYDRGVPRDFEIVAQLYKGEALVINPRRRLKL